MDNSFDLNRFMDRYEAGVCFDAYKYFGAHPDKRGGMIFRVYAPGAKGVSLKGVCNRYMETPMQHLGRGVYEIWMPYGAYGQFYKYVVVGKRGAKREHQDPYAFGQEAGGGHCSIIRDPFEYRMKDFSWMEKRREQMDAPMTIYEVHPGSYDFKSGNRFNRYSYTELAGKLIPYLKKNHYSHVEFLPLCEHPMDESLGYQITGFFAPTSRYGTISDLRRMVELFHESGIGVIFDYVSVHFAADHYGLKSFDGSCLYEYKQPKVRKSDWGSYCFDHTKGSVRSFLNSAAAFLIEVLHADGLRYDAVSWLLYKRGREDLGLNEEGQLFLRKLNGGLAMLHPDVLLMAEDSTAYFGITKPVNEGGFGFHYKWALGFIYDTLSFFTAPMQEKGSRCPALTFSLSYFFSERYLMPFCHDEVGFGKKSLLMRMPGSTREKSGLTKTFLLYLLVHPGAKLFFMGTELPLRTNWDVRRALPWDMLSQAEGKRQYQFMEDALRVYHYSPALYENDRDSFCASWVSVNDSDSGIYALIRHSVSDHVLFIMNVTDEEKEADLYLPYVSDAELILSTAWYEAGRSVHDKDHVSFGYDRLKAEMPAFSAVLIRISF